MKKELTAAEIEFFIREGFVRVDEAFPAAWAEEGRARLWKDTGCDPDDPGTWIHPVVRLGDYGEDPFRKAVNTPVLHRAFDQLVGPGRWLPRQSLGSFPVRFPSAEDSGDTGWHVDASFPGDDPGDYLSWRINIHSAGRALLMLFLFSDTGTADAPTRIRPGSHREVARLLASEGDRGLSCLELAGQLPTDGTGTEVLATGAAGTVYLCHPFLVHAAQPHRGTRPRFLAQPPLHPAEPFRLHRPDGNYSPVEEAIRQAVGAPAS